MNAAIKRYSFLSQFVTTRKKKELFKIYGEYDYDKDIWVGNNIEMAKSKKKSNGILREEESYDW